MASVAEILLAQGQRSAEARRRMGEISARTFSDLGNIAAGAVQQYGQHREIAKQEDAAAAELEAERRRDAAMTDLLSRPEIDPREILTIYGPERGTKMAAGLQSFGLLAAKKVTDPKKTAGDLAIGFKQFSPEMRTKLWPAIRAAAIAGGLGDESTIPEQPDDSFIDGVIGWATGQAPKTPEGFTLSPGQQRFGPDGKPIAEVKPKPEPEKTYAVTIKGPGGRPVKRVFTESELQKGVEEYREPDAPRAQPSRFWVLRNGEPVRISEAEYQTGDRPAGGAAGTGRPATGAQNRVLGFFNRAQQADSDLEALEGEIQKMNLGQQGWMATMPNILQTDTGQKYTQAQRAFTEARLRKDSGAAIPNHEYANDRKTYFAQPGDSQATLEQKRAARAAVLASLAFEAGPALSGFLGDEAEARQVVDDYKNRAAGKKPVTAKPGGVQDIGAARGPQVGERRLINGKLGEWDGTGWKPVGGRE